jgi:5-methylthioadenosine/S-adenosylhomocysteine deaminase
VLGIKKKTGSLEPGKYGDFLIINSARLGVVLEDPYAYLVYAGAERDIEQVYIGGELMVERNHVLHHNSNKIQAEVKRRVMAGRY